MVICGADTFSGGSILMVFSFSGIRLFNFFMVV
jgi:hypothetical protein